MSQTEFSSSKNQILAEFEKLLAAEKENGLKVATREEEAKKQKNQELLELASGYTVDNIVNTMASLQLDFGNIISNLSGDLTTEANKLDELKRAIVVEQKHLEQIQKVRLVADALYILRQEHQERLRLLENNTNEQREAITKEMEQTRKLWEQEEQEFTTKVEEENQLLAREREKEAVDYQYTIERNRKIETDEYEEIKRLQEREMQQLSIQKEKSWEEREQILTEQEPEFVKNQEKVAGFEEELKQAYNKARGDAIKDAEREAKVKADLIEKEWEVAESTAQLEIQSLEETIESHRARISELNEQLQAATNQAQNLAMRAFANSAASN